MIRTFAAVVTVRIILKGFNVNSPEWNSGNNNNRCVKTLKGLNEVSKEECSFYGLTLSGLGNVLNVKFPEFHSGLFMLNPFRIRLKMGKS